MPVLIRATVDQTEGIARLRFPFDRPTIDLLKSVPGSAWDKASSQWVVPANSLPVFTRSGLKILETSSEERRCPLPEALTARLRPYQIEGAEFLTRRRGALLTMDPRTGKTPTAITAACALMQAGHAEAVVILYPNAVRGEWIQQPRDWAGLSLKYLEGNEPLSGQQQAALHTIPYLAIGCHYEILDKHLGSICGALWDKKYIVIADELHYCKNRKIERTKVLWDLAHHENCVARWGLTGTPMRNRPRDLWALFEFIGNRQCGTYWQFAKRYCAAIQNDMGFWEDKGESNLDELQERLAAVSYRKTRQEVAAWLPPMDLKVVMCHVPEKVLANYRKLERAFAPEAKAALENDEAYKGEETLRQLTQATSRAKIPTAVARAYEHAERGVKLLVFAHFHETLQALDTAFDDAVSESRGNNPYNPSTLPPHFCAGGWMLADKRRAMIDRWKSCPGPAILLVNSLSSGIGIDLSAADTAIFLELEWVPSDLKQAMDRIVDVHKGTRTTPPLYEMLLVAGTIDEAMAGAVLHKSRAIDQVVGLDAETRGVSDTIRGAGVVGSSRLGLVNTSDDAVAAALASIRDRLFGKGLDADTGMSASSESLAAAFEDNWADEEPDSGTLNGGLDDD